jgi:hypothetical protein
MGKYLSLEFLHYPLFSVQYSFNQSISQFKIENDKDKKDQITDYSFKYVDQYIFEGQ